MQYVDQINLEHGAAGTKLYSATNTQIKKLCLEHNLHLLEASVRHLGTDINYVVLEKLYEELSGVVDFFFNTPVEKVSKIEGGFSHLRRRQGDDLQPLHHLRRPQRQQVDGDSLRGSPDPNEIQPGGHRRPRRAAV